MSKATRSKSKQTTRPSQEVRRPQLRSFLSLDRLEDRTTPASVIYDLNALPGNTANVNGAQFTHTTLSGGGQGQNAFITLQVPGQGGAGGAGIEQGYNTNAKPADYQFDTMKQAQAILLSSAPVVHMNGQDYREFVLDVDESVNQGHSLIVLNDLRAYVIPTAVSGSDTPFPYDAATRTLGGFAPVYDLDTYDAQGNLVTDNSLTLDGGGSGKADMIALLPVSDFGNLDPNTTYVYLYSKLGDYAAAGLSSDYIADDGPEHWSVYGTAQSPTADLAVQKTDSPDPIIPGNTLTYTITVTNNGPDPVSSVLLTDTVPSLLTSVAFHPPAGTTFSPTQSGNVYSGIWNLSTPLGSGQSIQMTVTGVVPPNAGPQTITNDVVVATTGGTGDSNLSNNEAKADTLVQPQANLTVTKTDGTDTVIAGAPDDYTITVTNTGPNDLNSITFKDVIPPELLNPQIIWPSGSTATYDAGTNTYTLTGISLPVGGNIVIHLIGTVSPSATGTMTDTVTVAPPPGWGGNPATDTDVDTIKQQADLSVFKTDNVDEVFAGQQVSYFITVTNPGPSDISGTLLDDVFPPEISSHSWSVVTLPPGASVTPSSGTNTDIHATINLPAHTQVVIRVDWVVGAGLTPGTKISNTATITPPDSVDPNPLNNSSTHDDTVIAPPLIPADLQITKTHSPEPAVAGAQVSYQLVAKNNGPNDVTGATVTDNLDTTLFVSGTLHWNATNGHSGTGDVSDTLGLLANGASVTYTITGTLRPDLVLNGILSIPNEAVIGVPAGVGDPDLTNNQADDLAHLQAQVVLGLTKDDGQTTAVPGTPIAYTITLTNNGPSTISSVTLTDTPQFLEPGYTFSTATGQYNTTTHVWSGFVLGPGGSIQMTLKGTISPSATGSMTNTTTVTPIDATGPSVTADDTDQLIPTVDVSIVKTNPVPPLHIEIPGLPVTYTITVSNTGPSDAAGVRVADAFPAILTGATWTSTASGSATGNSASGSGNINDLVNLPVGGSIVYTVTALVDPLARGQLSNTATATVAQGTVDTDPGNNTSTHVDDLAPQADLSVTKSHSPDSVPLGGTLTYFLTVTNGGPSSITSFQLTEQLPPQFQVTSYAPSTGSYDPNTGTWSGLNFAKGQSVVLTVTGTVTGGANETIVNTVTVVPPNGVNDVNLLNNTASNAVPVTPAPPVPPAPPAGPGPAAPIPLLPIPDVSKRDFFASAVANRDPLTGSYREAVADFNRDGVADTVIAPAAGEVNYVHVLDGRTGALMFSANPFGPTFNGGVFVTTGDLTGDGVPDLIVSPDQGGGPRVQIYSGNGFTKVLDFLGIDDPNFRGGVRLAVGDVNGDGAPDLIVAAGYGGGPRVTVWDGASIRAGAPVAIANFFAFEPELRNGVYVAAGDVDGDGVSDLILGGGPGGAPRIRIISGAAMMAAGGFSTIDQIAGTAQMANFFSGDTSARDGVRVAFWDANGDGLGEVVAGSGPGAAPDIGYYSVPGILKSPTSPTDYTDVTGLMNSFSLSGVFVG